MKIIAYIIGGLIAIPLIAVLSIYEGWCLKWLWLWFVSQPFNITPLSIPVAIGISLITGVLTYQTIYEPREVKDRWNSLTSSLLRPGISLLIGYIVKSFFL